MLQQHVARAAVSARACCGRCFGTAAAHGYRRLELEVFATNTNAIRRYEREGFSHEGRRRGAVMVGEDAVDMLMMGRGI